MEKSLFDDFLAGDVVAGETVERMFLELQANRFGSDKASGVLRGRPLLQWVLDAVGQVCAAVVVAGTLTAWLAGQAAASRDAVRAVKEDW